MSVNVAEYFNKVQEEGLKSLKQTQDASLAAFAQFRALGSQFAEQPGTVPTLENVPTPTQLVEMSFGFAGQILEMRKAYTLKLAEMFVDSQKRTEAAVKAASQPQAETSFKGQTEPAGARK